MNIPAFSGFHCIQDTYPPLFPINLVYIHPVLPEFPHKVPVSCPLEPVFCNQIVLCLNAPHILKPHHMGNTFPRIVKIRCLGLFIIQDFRPVKRRPPYCLQIPYGFRLRDSLFIGQRPVICIIWDSHIYFFRRNYRNRIIQHPPHAGNWGNCHGRTVFIRSYPPCVLCR